MGRRQATRKPRPSFSGPARTCAGCRKRRPRGEMLRLTGSSEGNLEADDGCESRRRPGRGVWICSTPECVTAAVQRGQWSRALRRSIRSPAAAELGRALAGVVRSQVLALMGAAWRQGELVVGVRPTARSLGRGEARLVVIAEDAAESVRRRLGREAARRGVGVTMCGDGRSLGAVGRRGGKVSVVGLSAEPTIMAELCRRAQGLETLENVAVATSRGEGKRGARPRGRASSARKQ